MGLSNEQAFVFYWLHGQRKKKAKNNDSDFRDFLVLMVLGAVIYYAIKFYNFVAFHISAFVDKVEAFIPFL